MAKKTAVVVNDYFFGGGAETVFRAMCSYLDVDKGWHVTAFTAEAAGIKRNFINYFFNIKAAISLFLVLLRSKPDLIWFHNYYQILTPSVLLAARIYKLFFDVRVVTTTHDLHLICPNPVLLYFENGAMKRLDSEAPLKVLFRQAKDSRGWVHTFMRKGQWFVAYKLLRLNKVFDAVFCPSSFVLDCIKAHYPSMRCYLLRNPISNKPALTDEDFYFCPCSKISLVFAGRLSIEKGVAQFLRDCKAVNCDLIEKVVLIGDGPEKENIKDLVSELNLKFPVSFRGALPHKDVLEAVKESDAVFLPGLSYENAPMLIVEAALLKKPILVNDFGSMSSFGREVGNAVFFNVGDSASLKSALESLTQGVVLSSNLEQFGFSHIDACLDELIPEPVLD